jgi:glycosyltransferase involved in cell wall biosynthesis
MYIGYDAKRFFFNKAGLGKYSRELISAILTEYPNHKISLFVPSLTNKNFDSPEGLSLITNTGILPNAIWRQSDISSQNIDNKINVFHGLSNELPFLHNSTKTPAIVTIHDVLFLDYPKEYSLIDRSLYTLKLSKSIKIASKIIAVSQYTKNRLLHYFPECEFKIRVINPPIDTQYWIAKSTHHNELPNIPNNFLLFVGTWGKRKNLHNVLKSMDLLKWNLPLIVIGKIGESLKEEKYKNKIISFPYVSDELLKYLYQKSEALVYPSLDEGFGLPVTEALLSGTRVITSNNGALLESSAGMAYYCDPLDPGSIAETIQNALLQPKMTLEIRQNLSHVNKFNVAHKMMELYKEVIEQSH